LKILDGVEVEYGENKDLIMALMTHTLKETLLIVMEFDDQLHVNSQMYSPKQLAFQYFKGLVNSPPFREHEGVRYGCFYYFLELVSLCSAVGKFSTPK
jgi:hypothetical protein